MVQGGEVQGFRLLAGSFGIPAVAFDGTTGGLSGDGRWVSYVGDGVIVRSVDLRVGPPT